MAKPLNRKSRETTATNPFMDVEKKEKKVASEPLATMKVPASSHAKAKALSKTIDTKLVNIIDVLVDYYAETALSEEQKNIYNFMKSQEK